LLIARLRGNRVKATGQQWGFRVKRDIFEERPSPLDPGYRPLITGRRIERVRNERCIKTSSRLSHDLIAAA